MPGEINQVFNDILVIMATEGSGRYLINMIPVWILDLG